MTNTWFIQVREVALAPDVRSSIHLFYYMTPLWQSRLIDDDAPQSRRSSCALFQK
jgi:hypothetical protein